MKYLKETTDWTVPNHTYIVAKNGWLLGYIKQNTTEEILFSQPIKTWSEKNRTFEKVEGYSS